LAEDSFFGIKVGACEANVMKFEAG